MGRYVCSIYMVLHYLHSMVAAFACKMHICVSTEVSNATMQQQAKHEVHRDTHFMERQPCGCMIDNQFPVLL